MQEKRDYMQHQITEKTKLLTSCGNVAQPGYCLRNLYEYNRNQVKLPGRLKEWDFYQITNERYTVQATIANISIAGAGSLTIFDRTTGERHSAMLPVLLPKEKIKMPLSARAPSVLQVKSGSFDLKIENLGTVRNIFFSGKNKRGGDFKAKFAISQPAELESITFAVPFQQKKHFYYNEKINCMPTKGYVKIGNKTIDFDPTDSFCVLDWGRGVWPYKEDWYWGNGSTRLPDGTIFGFDIGWGFGDMSAANENCVFVNGKGHKLDKIYLNKDEHDYMKPWMFTSNDGRFEMTMTPTFDNFNSTRILGVVGNICHQVFGKWNGTVRLDDGTTLYIKDMTAFNEYSDNRW